MFKMLMFILFFPFAIIYYGLALLFSIILGVLRLIGLVDIARKL